MKLSPYLSFNGNCREAFAFYKEVFGGDIVMMISHADLPADLRMPHVELESIMHARLVIGDVAIMGGDTPAAHFVAPAGIFISMIVDTPEDAERIFAQLADGGTVRMPISETFFSERFGMVIDKYGQPWMINGGERGM